MQLIDLQWEATTLKDSGGSLSGWSLKSHAKSWSQFGMHRTETTLSWENRGDLGQKESVCSILAA